MLNTNYESLSETLDAVNQAVFYHKPMTAKERTQAATWIADRRGKAGSYFGMFAPTENDFKGIKVFTGEQITTRAGISHLLGEEACRALIHLNVADTAVKEALKTATQNMLQRLRQSETGGQVQGMYCCGNCSVAYWRNIIAGGLDRNEERLLAAMSTLKSYRAGNARWRRFPFYYTLLALSEMDIKPAIEEMRYAAPILVRYLKRNPVDNEYSKRRRLLSERILAKC